MCKLLYPIIILTAILSLQISCIDNPINRSVNNIKTNTKELSQKELEDELEDRKRIINTNRIYHNWLLQDTDKQLNPRKIIPLRIKSIGENDIEIRFWYGFGESLYGPKALILERKKQNWRAVYLPSNLKSKTKDYSNPLKLDWNSLWNNLEKNEILTIPSSTDVGNLYILEDQNHILVEVREGLNYRSYEYPDRDISNKSNVQQKKYSDKLLKICSILSTEFNTSLCAQAE